MQASIVHFNGPSQHGNHTYYRSIGTESVVPNTTLSFKALARQSKLKRVARGIKRKNFPEGDLPRISEYCLIRFQRKLYASRIKDLLQELNLEPATLREVLSFLRQLSPRKRRKLLEEFDLVALGSCWKKKSELRIPFINFRRQLRISMGGIFTDRDVFLVRILPSSPVQSSLDLDQD